MYFLPSFNIVVVVQYNLYSHYPLHMVLIYWINGISIYVHIACLCLNIIYLYLETNNLSCFLQYTAEYLSVMLTFILVTYFINSKLQNAHVANHCLIIKYWKHALLEQLPAKTVCFMELTAKNVFNIKTYSSKKIYLEFDIFMTKIGNPVLR